MIHFRFILFFFFFFYCSGDHRDLHSFPTRRSSDLSCSRTRISTTAGSSRTFPHPVSASPSTQRRAARSEEHTSELQSRQYLVCRLLLEKKKKQKKHKPRHNEIE